MTDYTDEQKAKLKAFFEAMDNLHGIPIPYNLICNYFAPLRRWVVEVLDIKEAEL